MALRRGLALAAALAAAHFALPAAALEFRSVGAKAAILYDAPSAKANRLYVLGKGYPVELLVTLEGWYKVRDATGELAWIEAKDLSPARMVMVKVARADVRAAPQFHSWLSERFERHRRIPAADNGDQRPATMWTGTAAR